MNRAFYSNSISKFLDSSPEEILGILALNNQCNLEKTQRDAWLKEIEILKEILASYRNNGSLYLEFFYSAYGTAD